jgi:hypothetical protein
MSSQAFLRSTTMLSGLVGASFFAVMAAQAADMPVKAPYVLPPELPAVDGINYKFDVLGGSLAEHGFGGVRGAVSIPLDFRYGLQIDGVASGYRGDFLGAIGAHLFWRDPAIGLLGIYASHTHWSKFGGVYSNRIALEAESYQGPWTFSAVLGVEDGNSTSRLSGTTLTTYSVGSRFYDIVDISYYMNENARVSLGHRYLGGKHALALGAEWARPIAPRALGSFFLEGRIGESDYKSIWAGLRVYFGNSDKPLIRRHREDDPRILEPEAVHSINRSQSFIGGEGSPQIE